MGRQDYRQLADQSAAPAWVADAVFYQIFVERFANGDPHRNPPHTVAWDAAPTPTNFMGGDLQGILDHLPYLQELGVTALYLTPIFRANTNHKYDTCDYLEVDPAFGDTALLQQLVQQAHQRGIRVVLDAVFNHCGAGFWAFQDVGKNGSASPYADWFFLTDFPLVSEPPNYQTCGGAWYLPKLNVANPAVQDYLLKVGRHWIETCDIDGWRLDVPWKIAPSFWQTFRQTVKAIKPDAYIVAEVWRDARDWLAGDTVDGVMNYPLREYTLDFCARHSMDAEDFDYECTRLRTIQGNAVSSQLNLLGSHDTPRLLTLCGDNIERASLAVLFMFTYLGAPMIYYGDEIGLRGANDPGCRASMPWDTTLWNQPLHQLYRQLIRLRHEHFVLRHGPVTPLWTFNGVYAYRRGAGAEQLIIILNPRDAREQVRIPLPAETAQYTHWHDLLSGQQFRVQDQHLFLPLLPVQRGFILTADVGV